jgi:hypothetical protein
MRGQGFREQIRQHLRVHLTSPNAIDPGQTFTAFWVSVLAGARRFAHAGMVRADRSLHALLGVERFPTDDTLRNLFKRFRQKLVYESCEPLRAWQLQHLPKQPGGY